MRIRWKLFWLLAALSLAPLLFLRINSHLAANRVAERLSTRIGAHLVDEAQTRLGRFVEDHARLLASRRQTLALAVAAQAMAVETALRNPPPFPDDPGRLAVIAPPDDGRSTGGGPGHAVWGPLPEGFADAPGYFRLTPDNEKLPLPVDPGRLTLYPPPNRDGRTTERPLAVLFATLPACRRIAAEVGPLAHFQATVLADGAAAVYPARPAGPRNRDPRQSPWYQTALAADGPIWSPAQAEPGTGRISVAVASRVAGPDGAPAGVTAIFTPLDDLLASITPPGHIAATVRTILVATAPGANGKPSLLVEAGDVRRQHGHGQGWRIFVTPAPLDSPDDDILDAVAEDVAKGISGVRRLTYHGRRSLAAYARTADNEALVQIAPMDAVLAEAIGAAQDVEIGIGHLSAFDAALAGVLMLALIFASLSASRAVTRPVLALIGAARRLAAGDFTARVVVKGRDELAELGRTFNGMAPTLEAHFNLCESVGLASEIQRSLLPARPPVVPGLRLAAATRYCDETGGDYFDFLPFDGPKAGRLGVIVGDVSGHGLEAALLMTTARALLRPRAARAGSPAEVVADVNRELTRDTYGTGRFMTLSYLEIEAASGTVDFARAGHDPALLHDAATGEVTELTVRGMALGVAEEAAYETRSVTGLGRGDTLLIGSDGLWEAENATGEMFGKTRTRDILARTAARGPQAVLDALLAALDAFRGDVPLADDVTLVVVAFDGS